ncbi:hypothetical protein [Ornithinimicrobium faecis]|nr:hypothetical protein [Ornithinimicrobium sp. HY1793]
MDRELRHDDDPPPEMDEVLARIATREPVEASSEDIREFIADGHR